MSNSPSVMPGAFNFHTAPRDSATSRLSGAKSHIFRPPLTPTASASSSLIMTRSSTSGMSISSAGDRPSSKFTRKRTLEDYHEVTARNTPRMMDEDWHALGDSRDEACTPGSPKMGINTRYALAGGMDTPGLAAQQASEERSQYGDDGYRKSLGDTNRPIINQGRRSFVGEHEGGDYFGRECNGRGRYQSGSDSPQGEGWSKTAIQVAGAVVGKAWEFCKNSAAVFRGFQAGGGTGYTMDNRDNFEAMEQSVWEEKRKSGDDGDSTPLPGQYPTEELEYISDYIDRPENKEGLTPDQTPRPSKRRQVSANQTHTLGSNEEIGKNWVVVPIVSTPVAIPAQPRLSRFSMPTASSASRRSVANTSLHRPASRAGFTNPGGPLRRSNLTPQKSRVSHAGSPALKVGGGASYASPRSPANSGSRIPRATGSPLRTANSPRPESPAVKEAKRWVNMKRKEDREADESIRRLDAQLKAMIREGREALGTKIEVESEEDDDMMDFGPKKTRPDVGGGKKWAF